MASNDNELRRQLIKFGMSVGPITDSTRDLYKRMLQKKMKATGKTPKQSFVGRSVQPSSSNSGSTKSVKSRNIPLANSPAAGNSPANKKSAESPIPSIPFHSRKRPPSNASYEAEPKRSRLDTVAEKKSKISPEPSKPTVSSSPKYQRLYPTLPEDVNSKYLAPSEPLPRISHQVSPIVQQPRNAPAQFKTPTKLPPRAAASPPSPSPSFDLSLSPSPSKDQGRDDGFFSGVVGQFKKLVNHLASPRKSLETAKKSSTGHHKFAPSVSSSSSSLRANSLSSVHDDTVSVREIEPEDVSPPLRPISEPEPTKKERPSSNEREWELQPSDVDICKKPNGTLWRLGKGGFGEVFKGIKDSVDEVAVKVIRVQNSSMAIEQFKKEIDIISKLRHRHILQFYGACIQPNCFYMVTELMQTDLFSSLRQSKRYMWTGIYGKDVLVGVASGLHYLHSRKPPIVHRDIKSPNILLMDGVAKLADVGIARTKSDSDMTAQKGYTIAWAAPEVVYRRRATEKIDIWGFGVIIWEVVSGKMPRVGHLALPSDAPSQLRSLYNSCVEEDPIKRPSAAEAIKQLKAIK